ncbi:hypothetical protein BN1097_700048 [Clostridioides difficile]|uniref:Uncharacterized protein n=1 Tax=Clostridioides difficile TaxID=1496 RepID=A0A069AIK6_CLODI|nr:hypothetical protein BN1097_700048 [Clostridioides difficile]
MRYIQYLFQLQKKDNDIIYKKIYRPIYIVKSIYNIFFKSNLYFKIKTHPINTK